MLLIKPRKNRKGFTLVELIIVVAILAILAAVAVPQFIGLQSRAKQGVDIANASALVGAINTFNAMQTDKANWCTDTTDWTTISGKIGAANMPVISGGTGAALANWQAAAVARITVSSGANGTGVATVSNVTIS